VTKRCWTKKEVYLLYHYAEHLTQPEAAKKLNRTLRAVQAKVKTLKIKWGGGSPTLNSIAREFNCAPSTVSRMFHILVDPCRFVPGKGNGRRYRLNDWEADRLRNVLKGTLKYRDAYRQAGRMNKKSYYHRQRQALLASAFVDLSLRKQWEVLEKALGRALTLFELKEYVGYVNKKGQYVRPRKISS
jgi:AraC-like DNA-binding protein